MRRTVPLCLLLVLLLAGAAQAHPSDVSEVEPAGEATVTVTDHGGERGSTFAFELTHEDGERFTGEVWTELSRGSRGEDVERQVLRPDEDGVYRLHVDFDPSTPWTLSLIYGYGFDVKHALLEDASVPDEGQGTQVFTEPIYALHPEAPGWLNLWGYVAYGVLLLVALAGVVVILRRLDDVTLGGPTT